MTPTKLMKRLLIALVSLLAVSAAFALGAYSDLPSVGGLPSATVDAASSWAAGLLAGEGNGAWKVLAAVAVMAVIAKRNGKA